MTSEEAKHMFWFKAVSFYYGRKWFDANELLGEVPLDCNS
jgi:hypothetical protein